MCDKTSDKYNKCAANLKDCLLDPNFELCNEFPSLCGYEDDFKIPVPKFYGDWPGFYSTDFGEDMILQTCEAVFVARYSKVLDVVENINHFYGSKGNMIKPGNSWDFEITMGARKWDN
jgi:hypothetical protein